ncbi:hypothetical protein ABT173_14450 [Streptomyces sp. NPDC001795]|uniref:hypothetical protein n=1 Tax=unclassified Streptomyces TaxID=2593676 RepID=UPI003326CC9E
MCVHGDELPQPGGQAQARVVPDEQIGPPSWTRTPISRSYGFRRPKRFGWSLRPVHSRTAWIGLDRKSRPISVLTRATVHR